MQVYVVTFNYRLKWPYGPFVLLDVEQLPFHISVCLSGIDQILVFFASCSLASLERERE